MKKIEALEPSKHIQGRFLIRFEGQNGAAEGHGERGRVLLSLFRSGVGGDELAALQKAGSLSSAKARGARMLGERPLSRKELVRRLTKKKGRPRRMPRPPPTGWRISAHWMKRAMPAASCAITPAGATAFSAFGRNCTAGAFPGNSGRMPWKSGAIRRSGSPHS